MLEEVQSTMTGRPAFAFAGSAVVAVPVYVLFLVATGRALDPVPIVAFAVVFAAFMTAFAWLQGRLLE